MNAHTWMLHVPPSLRHLILVHSSPPCSGLVPFSLLILSPPLDIHSEDSLPTSHSRFISLHLLFSLAVSASVYQRHVRLPALCFISPSTSNLHVLYNPPDSPLPAQFRGCLPLFCLHPGAHPILGCGPTPAPGPTAESPTAPHSPAPSGS